jgi:hypothetical protein
MPVAVNQPQRREKQADPLDTIIKGLNIATSIYGIKEGMDKAKYLEQEKEAKAAQQLKDNEFKTRELDIKEKDISKPKEKVVDPIARELQMQRLDEYNRKTQEAAAKKAFDSTPEGKLSKLASSDKQRLDNAKLGLISTMGMSDALGKGDNTFSLVGDNDFTQQRTLFEEALGRMQSGGAITLDEANRFKKMAPTWTDSKEMQQKKLAQLQNEMSGRLQTLGFQPQDLGIAMNQPQGLKERIQSLQDPSMSSANAASNVKVMNGKTYIKVPGGWQEK